MRRRDALGVAQQLAARELADREAVEVERRALAGARARLGDAVDLEPAHARGAPARQHAQLVAERDLAAEHGAGDDRAEALAREHAIDRQAEHGVRIARRQRPRAGGERGA